MPQIDDDRTTRHLIAHQLRRAGYAVAEASDGEKALERVGREAFELVLLDVWMPGLDGLAVLARLRDAPARPRVVVMTADDASETLLRAIREQAYRYLPKPVDPAQLIEAIKSFIPLSLAESELRAAADAQGRSGILAPESTDPAQRQSVEDYPAINMQVLKDL